MGRKPEDRREHPRLDVFAGNAEITVVMGRGKKPRERARIVNWSRGGMLLRVSSPRRKLIFFQQPQLLHQDDVIACTLRLPPAYKDIDVKGGIVRVERVEDDPDELFVGVSFDLEATAPRQIEEVAKLLEPKQLTSWSQRMAAAVAKPKSQRVQPVRTVSKPSSQRAPKPSSARSTAQATPAAGHGGRVANQSQRLPCAMPPAAGPKPASRRLRKGA
jgi:hypothetical protein